MNLSDKGLALILSFEGKHRALGDGRYIAYRCPAGVWTIHAGVTEGVRDGMICTEAEGEAMFRRELAKFESAVTRLVTVEINQHQFDSLVSFAYNVGEGALAKSSLLKKLNAGDYDGAAQAFALYNKARNGGRDKPLVVMAGLTRRRAAETALFLRPVEAPAVPDMPQKVEAPPPVTTKEAHLEAHAELKEQSTPYVAVDKTRAVTGGGTIIGGGIWAMLQGALDTTEKITLTPEGILNQVGAAAQLVTKYGLPMLGLSFGVVLLCSTVQYVQRKYLTG